MAKRLNPSPSPCFSRGALSAALALVMATAGLLASCGSAQAAPAKRLEIYFIDVEGGQSTLIVTPDHHSLLIDTGFAGNGVGFQPGDPRKSRDAQRIAAAARDAGISQIDYLLITHFHPDHDGGVGELSQLLPIRVFVDHGVPNAEAENTSSETKDAFNAYVMLRSKGRHIQPNPGDRLPLQDLEAVFVSSAGTTLSEPLAGAGAPNGTCLKPATPPRDPYENPRSTGVVIRYGEFRFLDVGDLTGPPLLSLACPRSLIGPVDAYLVAHHGGPDVDVRETFTAWKPRVAFMNNGLTKGGALVTYQALHQVPGLEDVWQLHRSTEAGDNNFDARNIANLDESTAHWIKLSASEDGSFRVMNQRTGEGKSYAQRAR